MLFDGIVARVSQVKFKSDPYNQTVYYNEKGKYVESRTDENWKNDIDCVATETIEEAIALLRECVRGYLNKFEHSCGVKFNYKDFSFSIAYDEIKAGQFDIRMSIYNCKEYNVGE